MQRYDNMLKFMMARIEFHQGLAPVQTYGRHQTQAAQRKKKAKKPPKEGNTTAVVDGGAEGQKGGEDNE